MGMLGWIGCRFGQSIVGRGIFYILLAGIAFVCGEGEGKTFETVIAISTCVIGLAHAAVYFVAGREGAEPSFSREDQAPIAQT